MLIFSSAVFEENLRYCDILGIVIVVVVMVIQNFDIL